MVGREKVIVKEQVWLDVIVKVQVWLDVRK